MSFDKYEFQVSVTCVHCFAVASYLRSMCCRYEEYLDSQISATDMFYLEDVELARHLVELG